jgi:hypothetical protein
MDAPLLQEEAKRLLLRLTRRPGHEPFLQELTMSDSVTVKEQKAFFRAPAPDHGPAARICITVRYDDSCGNGHNTFSITGEIYDRRGVISAGRLVEEVKKYLPQLTPLIKWNGCSSKGPFGYFENTSYFAGDKDCWGYRQGEQKRDRKGKLMWRLPSPRPEPIICADEQPVVEITYEAIVSEGKERQLDEARSAAIWPEATDEELCSPDLKERLEARLPGLLVEFQRAVESLGFTY